MEITTLIVGTLLAIPIAILANILTPRIQKLLDGFSKNRALARSKRVEQEYQQVKGFRESGGDFLQHLAGVMIKAFYITIFITVMGNLSLSIPALCTALDLNDMEMRPFFTTMVIIAQLLLVFGGVLVLNLCSAALRTFYRVTHFEAYEAVAIAQIRKLQATGVAIDSAKYGAGVAFADVAVVLRQHLVNGKIKAFLVTNSNMGGDPVPGVEKNLEVNYVVNGKLKQKIVKENDLLSLP